ncbi:MAG: cytochrome c550 [Bacillus sp. (in: firmicutes)]
MNRSPIIPFVMIMVFGIVLVFGLSLKGLGDAKEMAKEAENGGSEESSEQASASPEEIYQQNCISCHGENYEGGMGPALTGVADKYSAEEIKDIIQNGTSNGMPGGLVAEENLDGMVEWLSGL